MFDLCQSPHFPKADGPRPGQPRGDAAICRLAAIRRSPADRAGDPPDPVRPTHVEPPALRRPRLLMRAAVAGLQTYERGRDLRRLFGGSLPSPREAAARLEEAEEREELRRAQEAASYSPQRHVALLTALLAERRLLRASAEALLAPRH